MSSPVFTGRAKCYKQIELAESHAFSPQNELQIEDLDIFSEKQQQVVMQLKYLRLIWEISEYDQSLMKFIYCINAG